MILLFLPIAYPLDQLMALQGKVTQSGSLVTTGNLTVLIYLNSSGGTPLYNSSSDFVNSISNGYYDVMLGSGSVDLSLRYGTYYYLDLEVNTENLNFSGTDRKQFYSTIGPIDTTDIIDATIKGEDINASTNITITGNISTAGLSVSTKLNASGAFLDLDNDSVQEIDVQFTTSCVSGNRLYISGGNLACEAAGSGADGNCSVDGSCSNVMYKSGSRMTGNLIFGNANITNASYISIGTTKYIQELQVQGDINFTGNLYGSGAQLTGVAKTDTNCSAGGSCSAIVYDGDAGAVTVQYQNISNIPTCTGNNKLTYDGSTLSCGSDIDTNITYSNGTGLNLTGTVFSLRNCADTEILKYNTTSTEWECESDAGGTDGNCSVNGSCSNVQYKTQFPICSINQRLKYNASGLFCINNIDTNVTYTNGSGLILNTTTFRIRACGSNEILEHNNGAWSCISTPTTTSASGNEGFIQFTDDASSFSSDDNFTFNSTTDELKVNNLNVTTVIKLSNDSIEEKDISFDTSCSSGNRLYISSGNLACEAASASPSGSVSQVQFSGGASMNADANFTFNASTDELEIGGSILINDSMNGFNIADPAGGKLNMYHSNSQSKSVIQSSADLELSSSTTLVKVADDLNVTGLIYGNGSQLTSVTASPAGSDTEVQFNDGGSMGSDANFTWNKSTDILKVRNINVTLFPYFVDDAVEEADISFDTNCASGNRLYINAGNLACESAAASPSGSVSEIQFSGGATLSADSNFTFNSTTDTLKVIGTINATTFVGSGASLTGVAKTDTNCSAGGSCSAIVYDGDAGAITVQYQNISNIPTCTGNNKLTYDGSTLSCGSDIDTNITDTNTNCSASGSCSNIVYTSGANMTGNLQMGSGHITGTAFSTKWGHFSNSSNRLGLAINSTSMALMMKFNNDSGVAEDYNLTGNANFTVYDYSGSGHNGTFYDNGTTLDSVHSSTSGKFSTGGLNFDGKDDYIKFNTDIFKSATAGTITAWIKTSSTDLGGAILTYTNLGASDDYFTISVLSNGKLETNHRSSAATDRLNSVGTVTGDTWYHVAFVSDGSDYSYYINGVNQSLTAEQGSNSGRWFADLDGGGPVYTNFIGKFDRSSGHGTFFNGTIDDLVLWNRTLSAQEIYQEYIADTEHINHDENLKRIYIDENQSLTVFGDLNIGTNESAAKSNINVTGNVTAKYFIGNGSQLTNVGTTYDNGSGLILNTTTFRIRACGSNEILEHNNGAWSCISTPTTTSASGNEAYIQFADDASSFSSDANFTFNSTTDELKVSSLNVTTVIKLSNDSIEEKDISFDTSCTSGNRLYINAGNLACEAASASPSGSVSQVQFSGGASMNADANFTFNASTDELKIGGSILINDSMNGFNLADPAGGKLNMYHSNSQSKSVIQSSADLELSSSTTLVKVADDLNVTGLYYGNGSQLTGITATVTDVWVNTSGDTMTGNLTMGDNYILNSTSIKGVSTQGLLLYMPFEDADSGNQSLTKDWSGNSNDGTLNHLHESDWIDGQVGKALDFDGENDSIDLTGFTATGGLYTFSFWVKYHGGTGSGDMLFDSQTNRLALNYNQSNDLAFYDGSWQQFGSSPSNNVWHHIVYAFNATKGLAYVDGIQLGTAKTYDAPNLTGSIAIGSKNDGANHFFNGTIDEVRIYNRTLSLTEIKTLYQMGINDHQEIGGSWVSRDDVYTNNNGSVGINTTTPTNTLKVQGDINFTDLIYGNGSQLTDVIATPGGSDSQVQYNDVSSMGADANFTWDEATDTLSVGSLLVNGSMNSFKVAGGAAGNINMYYSDMFTKGVIESSSGDLELTTTSGTVQLTDDLNVTGLYYGNGSQLTGITATVTDVWVNTSGDTMTGNLTMGDNYILNSTSIKGVSTQGLLLYMPFEDADSGNQSLTKDWSGNSNDGTLNHLHESDWIDGQVGKALDFDGENDSIDLTGFTATGGLYTFSFWVKYHGGTGSGDMLFDSQTNRLALNYNQSNDLAFYDGSWQQFGSSPSNNVWHHIVYAFNATKGLAYVDGIQLGTAKTYDAPNLTGSIAIGSKNDGANHFFNGTIDEVRIYNRTLSLTEIKTLYQMGINDHQEIGGSWVSRDDVYTNNNGSVGINTTTPTNTLKVQGDINFTDLIYGNGSQLTDVIATPGGSDSQVQYNDVSSMGADANFTWDEATDTLSVGSLLVNGSMNSFKVAGGAAGNINMYYSDMFTKGVIESSSGDLELTTTSGTVQLTDDLNVTGLYYGNGSQLTGITASVTDVWVNSSGDILTGEFNLSGSLRTNASGANVISSISGQVLDGLKEVYVQGQYAYVTASTNNSFSIIDISDKKRPIIVSTYENATLLDDARGIFILGKYAYVAGYTADRFSIFDVSNPINISYISTVVVNGANEVFVQGKYAYLSTGAGNTINIYDISDPNNILFLSTLSEDNVGGVYAQGKYVYTVADDDHEFFVIDVSIPSSPVIVGSLVNSTHLPSAYDVYVSGSYAYVACLAGGVMSIVNISNPTNPNIVGTYDDVATGAQYSDITVQGDYAYLTDLSDDEFYIIDVSNKTNPTQVLRKKDANFFDSVRGLFVDGKYIYTTSLDDDMLTITELDGIRTPTLSTGSLEASSINVKENMIVGHNIYAGDSIVVGDRGIMTSGDLSVAKNVNVTNNVSATYFIGDGSQLSGITATDLYVNESGDTMSGHLDMGWNQITSVNSINWSVNNENLTIYNNFGKYILGSTTNISLDAIEGGNGQVEIWDKLQLSADLEVDSTDLFVDVSENKVGIGTATPNQELHVVGTTNITENLFIGGNITSSGADFAEMFDSDEKLQPGDVVCLTTDYKVKKCDSKANPAVAGVVSEKPTIIGNSQNGKYAVGIVGIVKTKVKGPIKSFELLTTSSKKGYAEKASINDFGAILGKAMQPCYKSECKINVLIGLR